MDKTNEIQERDSTEITSTQTSEAPTRSEPKAEKVEAAEKPSRTIKQSLRANLREEKVETPKETGPSKIINKIEKPVVEAPTQQMEAPGRAATMVAPPSDMTKEEAAFFATLPPEAQAYLSRRAYETQRRMTEATMAASAKEREVADIYQVVTPEVRQSYARHGISVPQLVQRAIAWDQRISQDRIGGALEYLEAYGIDPRELVDGYTPQEPEYTTQEDVQKTIRDIIAEEYQKSEQARIAEENNNAVKSFISSNPLFQDPGTAHQLEEEMAREIVGLRAQGIQASPAEILKIAYERVTKLHPVFSSLTSQLAAKQEIERQQAEAQKAKALSRTIKGGPGQGTPKHKSENLRENLRSRYFGGA